MRRAHITSPCQFPKSNISNCKYDVTASTFSLISILLGWFIVLLLRIKMMYKTLGSKQMFSLSLSRTNILRAHTRPQKYLARHTRSLLGTLPVHSLLRDQAGKARTPHLLWVLLLVATTRRKRAIWERTRWRNRTQTRKIFFVCFPRLRRNTFYS